MNSKLVVVFCALAVSFAATAQSLSISPASSLTAGKITLEPSARYVLSPALAKSLNLDFDKLVTANKTDHLAVSYDNIADQLNISVFDESNLAGLRADEN